MGKIMDSKIIFFGGVLWGVGDVARSVTLTVETTVPPFCARQRDSSIREGHRPRMTYFSAAQRRFCDAGEDGQNDGQQNLFFGGCAVGRR
jgi:hypothetical protein